MTSGRILWLEEARTFLIWGHPFVGERRHSRGHLSRTAMYFSEMFIEVVSQHLSASQPPRPLRFLRLFFWCGRLLRVFNVTEVSGYTIIASIWPSLSHNHTS